MRRTHGTTADPTKGAGVASLATGPTTDADDDTGRPIAAVFAEAAADSPDGLFLYSLSRPERYTYGSFHGEAVAIARQLARRGLVKGDRIAILAENRPRWCVAYAAVLLAGGVVVPLDAQLPEAGLVHVLQDAAARAIFLSGALHERVGDALLAAFPNLLQLSLEDAGEHGFLALTQADGRPLPEPARADEPLAIIYTSGTTGDPKGVVLTNRNLQAERIGVHQALHLTRHDLLILFLPLNHVLSQLGSFVLAAAYRARVVHAEIKRGEDLLTVMRTEGVTVLLAVPLLYHLIHERIRKGIDARGFALRRVTAALMTLHLAVRRHLGLNFGRVLFRAAHAPFGNGLRALYSGGAMLDRQVQRDFQALGFVLGQAYGLTETTGCATLTPIDDYVPGSVGRPIRGTAIRIDQQDAQGIGEVWLRGPIVTSGYFGREQASRELFQDGWFRTGDLGHLDAAGNLFITGRIKEVIVLGNGKNVYPEEVEAHYARAPVIHELCVIGRRSTGGDRTEKLHAVIVPDFDALRQQGVTSVRAAIRDVIDKSSQALPAWQRVLSFDIVRDPLPRTATRKLQRFKVAALLDDAAAQIETGAQAGQTGMPDDPTARQVEALIRQRSGAKATIHPGASLELDLGLDSLNRMELLMGVEQSFGIAIAEQESAQVHTVADLLELVRSKGGEAARRTDERPFARVIAEAGAEHVPAWLRGTRSRKARLFFACVTALSRVAGRWLYALRWSGQEHLPPTGPFLLCPNHGSFLDGALLVSNLTADLRRRTFAVGAPVHVSGRFRGWFSRALNIVPLDSDSHVREALQTSAALLKQGRILLIFPEGRRTFDGHLQPLRDGAAVLACELDLPLVPCAILGTFEAWPRQQRWPRRGRVHIRFGQPLRAARDAAGVPVESAADLTARLRQALLDLGVPA